MFLTNWLMVTRIVAASVIEAVDYPTPEEFFLAFDGTNTLFMYGGSKDTSSTSNVAIYYDGYKHDTGNAYPVVLSEPGEYKALVDVCGTRYLTEAVTVGAMTPPSIPIGTPSTLAFHHGNFDNVYGDGDVSTAATNGHVYADTPTGTYSWGTLSARSTTSTNTTYEWTPSATMIADVLMVAGGGGGGNWYSGGGGGAGGLVFLENGSISGQKTVVVGNGGSGATNNPLVGGGTDDIPGSNGSDTSMSGFTTAIGGGGGASYNVNGNSGGSGGGGGYNTTGGAGTNNQGYDGGDSYLNGWGGGGGGGSGGPGYDETSNKGGNGGIGTNLSSIYGVLYGDSGFFASGGGGGGGARWNNSSSLGGSGGSGIVLLSYQYSTDQLTYNNYNKLTIANTSNANVETNLRLGANTWDIATGSNVWICKPGDYKSFTVDPDGQTAYFGNVTVGTVTEEVEVSPQLWWNTYTNSSTVDDSSPNNLDGTLNSVTDTDGAFTFDGSSSYIQMATTGATDSNVQLAMWDISCEFYKTGSGTTGGYIDRQAVVLVTKGINAGDGDGYDINYGLVIDSNNKLCTGFEEAGSNQIIIASTATISNDQWYTARATFDGTTLNLYLDETLEATATPTISPASSDLGPFLVGAGRYDTSYTPVAYFQGRIKNVKVYDDIFVAAPQPSLTSVTSTGTLAFHHGNFDDVYGDGTVSNAATNGHVYADTPTGTYTWGTLGSASNTTTETTYTWTPPSTITANVLMVAGGGGGGGEYHGGGGGAGGLVYNSSVSLSGQETIVVGSGGLGGTTGTPSSTYIGQNTGFTGLTTAIGGGQGGGSANEGGDGGSGGGGSGYLTKAGGNGVAGPPRQGYNGGYGHGESGYRGGGGGGGSGGAGGHGSDSEGGDGGTGLDYSSVFGTTYGESGWFAGGGGGGVCCGSNGSVNGGQGDGGDGLPSGQTDGSKTISVSGSNHTGGGGGGASRSSGTSIGGAGGSGIVLISNIPLGTITTPSLTYDGYNKLTTVGGYADQTLYKDSNSWSLGTASNVYIAESGEYIYFTRDAATAFLANVVVGSVSVDLTLSETSIVKQFIYDENGYTDARFSEASETQSIRLSSDGLAMALGDGNYNSNDGRLYYYERSSISDTFTKTHTFDAVSSGLEFGASVDMNAAKTRIAISGSDADNSAANAGRVYIYDRASTSASWPSSPTATITPPASTIKRFGHTVNMSDDGLTIITSGDGNSSTANESGVYVYEYAVTAPSASTISFSSGNFNNNNSYYEKGATTTTTVLYNRRISSEVFTGYGLLLEYQSDGTTKAYCNSPSTENLDPNELSVDGVTWTDSVIIAVGDTLRGRQSSTNPGENFVFTVTSEHLFSQGPEWSKTFQVTQGISRFGFKVAMNKNGTRFIAGGTNTAYYVYHKESGTWSSTAALTGETGYHCGMSPDGNTVAVGIVQYSSNLGRVAVYKYSGGSWGSATNIDTTVGSGIYSFGNTPAFNNDGTLLVTGCLGYNSYMGCFEMWKYESGSWVFKNQFLNPTVKTGHGNDTGEFFGGYLSMDYAGTS